MAMVVKNNMSAVRTLNTLNQNSSALSKSLSRVSSGMKINSAQDDAAGYAISERMRVRIRSLDQANQNTQNDSSLMKTAEGAVANTVELLRALKEKAINAANDSNTDEDRQTIQKELNQFIDQIDDNALVQFNGKYLVDGSKNNAVIDTKTVLLNQSLKAGTQASDALTTMANRAGDSLGIQTTDKWQVSWVQNGEIHTTSGTVGTQSLKDIISQSVKTTDANGNEVAAGVVAATSSDGLIGVADVDPMVEAGYSATAMAAVENAKGLTDADVLSMLSTVDSDVTASVSADNPITCKDSQDADVTIASLATVTDFPVTISGYYAKNADNEAQAVTINIDKVDTNGDVTYNVSVLDADGKEVDTSSPLTLYTVDETNYTDEYIEAFTTKASYASDGSDLPDSPVDLQTPGAALTSGGSSGQVQAFSAMNLTLTDVNGNTSAATLYTQDADGNYVEVDMDKVGLSKNYGSSNGGAIVITNDVTAGAASDTETKSYGDVYTANTKIYVKNPDYREDSTPSVQDKFEKAVYTPDKTSGIAFVASEAGVDGQISGLTINILDQDGNVKKAANAALDQFKQYQRAENKTGDMSLNFHIGSEANVAIKVGLGDMRSEALGLKGSNGERILVTTKENANAAINVIENALTKALDQQTTIGAIEARLEYTSTNLTTSSENVQAAESTIRDADMAKEMTNYTKNNVLLQAAQAMLAQANQNSSAVLSLLQ